jgi:hypothetical protein
VLRPAHAPHWVTLLRHPFFQRYGVNLPSSLTEVHSITLGEFSRPTGVGLRYGHSNVWVAAFLGGVGADDSCLLTKARDRRHASEEGICLILALRSTNLSCPNREAHRPYRVPASLCNDALWGRITHLLAIAYDYDVLGLGPA